MLGFLPICGQFGENNELFVLTSYLPFFFYFSHWNYPYLYLWNCFFLSNTLWLFYLFLFNCLSGRHPLWIIGPSPSSSSFHDSPSQSNCLVTIGRKLVEDKVNHRERQGKASLKLATNHWRQQEATKKENMKNPQVIHYAWGEGGGVYGRILMVKICKGGNVSRYKVKADNLHTFLHICIFFRHHQSSSKIIIITIFFTKKICS